MKLYVAGPMTGYPDHNLPEFARVTSELKSVGYDVVNPGERGALDGWSWSDYLRADIPLLLACDAVAVLPGWENSKGARLEVTIAMDLEMPVHLVDWWTWNRDVCHTCIQPCRGQFCSSDCEQEWYATGSYDL